MSNNGTKLSKEHREKISKAHTGVCLSNEHRKKISEGHKGLKHTPKHIRNNLLARLGKYSEAEKKAMLANRFWSKVDIKDPSQCWNYMGYTHPKTNYGQFSVSQKPMLAHRMAWILNYGEIPEKICVCHTCDNKLCCNPAHLWLGTPKQNTQDMIHKKRNAFGEKNPRAILTESQVLLIREKHNLGIGSRTIARELSVSRSAIVSVIKRKTWTHI